MLLVIEKKFFQFQKQAYVGDYTQDHNWFTYS